jgi:hypothetical protein
MDITFKDDGTATINMKDYVKEAIFESGMDVSRSTATPARKNLFDIDDASEKLNNQQGDLFHSVVAKLLYVSHRGRIDIQLAIAFLCTRVSCSTQQDWAKLRRVLQYLNGTLDLFLTLGADSLTSLKTWVDASYAVHPDMKSHTGGAMSMGRGAFMCKSTKQKLNTKSSTEAEVVGASDYLPNTIWATMFLEAQGHDIQENIFAQDNQSAMRLEKNGRASCGQKSRHINIRFFFIKDRVSSGDISIAYCPTDEMLADFFTKPLQGNLFRKFRAVLLGEAHVSTLKKPLTPSEERVGKAVNEAVRTGVNGHGQTDTDKKVRCRISGRGPHKPTYASVTKKRISWAMALVK